MRVINTMNKLIRYFQRATILAGILVAILIAIPLVAGIQPFVVLSGSMEPKIKTGSIVYINKNVPATSINKSDIIGFNAGDNMIVTHRVVDINSAGFTTKGDANKDNDERIVKYSDYIGKTVFSIPFLGRVVAYFRTTSGVYWLTALIGLNILCIFYDKKIYKEDYELSKGVGKVNAKGNFSIDNAVSAGNKGAKVNGYVGRTLTAEERKENLEKMYKTLLEKSTNAKNHAFENYSAEQKEMFYKEMYSSMNEESCKNEKKHKNKTKKFGKMRKCKSFLASKGGKHAKEV